MNRLYCDAQFEYINEEAILYDEQLELGGKKSVTKEFYTVLFKYSWRLAFFFLIGVTFFFSSWIVETRASEIIIKLISITLLALCGQDILWRVRHDQDLRELLFGSTITVQKPSFLRRTKQIVKRPIEQLQSHVKFEPFSLSTPTTPSFEENFTMASSHYATPLKLFAPQSRENTTPTDNVTHHERKKHQSRDWKRNYNGGDLYQKRCSICPDCQNSNGGKNTQARCARVCESMGQQAQKYLSLNRRSCANNETSLLLGQEEGGLRRRNRVDYKWLATNF